MAAKKSANGKKPPVSPATGRTAYQDDRSERAFDLHLRGWTVRRIAVELNIDPNTVSKDLRLESERRAGELVERRELEKMLSVATYLTVIDAAKRKSEMYDSIALSGGRVVDHTLDAIVSARKRIDKVLGVDAPTKVELGLDRLLEALKPKDDVEDVEE